MKIKCDCVRSARIEMVPLIDCMFLILVSFTYSFLGMSHDKGIGVNLPKAVVQVVAKEDSSRTVSVTKEGAIFLDKNPVSLEALGPAILKGSEAQPKDMTVWICGDSAATHGRVVEVLDALCRAGITKVAVQTTPADPVLGDGETSGSASQNIPRVEDSSPLSSPLPRRGQRGERGAQGGERCTDVDESPFQPSVKEQTQ